MKKFAFRATTFFLLVRGGRMIFFLAMGCNNDFLILNYYISPTFNACFCTRNRTASFSALRAPFLSFRNRGMLENSSPSSSSLLESEEMDKPEFISKKIKNLIIEKLKNGIKKFKKQICMSRIEKSDIIDK